MSHPSTGSVVKWLGLAALGLLIVSTAWLMRPGPPDTYKFCETWHDIKPSFVIDLKSKRGMTSDTSSSVNVIEESDFIGLIAPLPLIVPKDNATSGDGLPNWEGVDYSVSTVKPANESGDKVMVDVIFKNVTPKYGALRRVTISYSPSKGISNVQLTDGVRGHKSEFHRCGRNGLTARKLEDALD